MTRDTLYTWLAAAVIALMVIPVGGAVFVLGFLLGDAPCVLCWEQRIGMILIALLGLFVLRYGPRRPYVGLAVIVAAWGLFMAVRHASLHVGRDIGQGFSSAILGAHTYTWAVAIYWACLIAVGVFLLAAREEARGQAFRTIRGFQSVAGYVFLVVVGANVVQAFASTGPPPFLGQADPVRFSFAPRHWVWSLEEWSPAPISWRGRWAVARPDIAATDPDPTTGPLADLPSLRILETRPLRLALRGSPTDLAYDATTRRFVLTSQHGVYVVNDAFDRLERSTVVDHLYSVDLGEFAGAAFLDARTIVAIGENKSYVVLRESERPDAARNYRFFLASFDQFDEVTRSRLSTVRARLMYVSSLAYDPGSQSLFTLTVPTAPSQSLVVSRVDRRDFMLSEEFLPALSPALEARLGQGRSPSEWRVTAATFVDGTLYALSAAHATLLAIDPHARAIVGAYAIPGLTHPTGMAVRDDRLYVVSADATLTLVETPREQ